VLPVQLAFNYMASRNDTKKCTLCTAVSVYSAIQLIIPIAGPKATNHIALVNEAVLIHDWG
jgi:hypothetical protein